MGDFATGTIQSFLRVVIPAIGLVTAVVLIAVMSRLIAPNPQSQPSPPPKEELASGLSDLQLTKFAVILSEIADIQARMKERMLQAANQAAVRQAEEEASTQMVEAVRRNGMSVEEYALISNAIQQDSELLKRFQKIQDGLNPSESGLNK
jgi:hypothetical protein